MQLRLSLVLATAFLGIPFLAPAASIWVEGENPVKSTMNRHPWWYDKVKKDVLSGGDWISNFDEKKEGTAEYAVEAPEAGDYVFWVRANPLGSLAYALDGAAWTTINLKADKRGEQNIAADNKPDLRFIAWVKVGKLTLAKGKHQLAFKISGGASNNGALDCFVLTTDPFAPQGTMKPGETAAGSKSAGGPADWFPLVADEDPFSPQSVIDMSKLIPAPAGQLGFVHAAGKDLKFDKGPAPKFWGCGANLEYGAYTHEQLTQRAKYLRKFGVNIVREHPLFDDVTTDGKIDAKKFDAYDWWFAELKKNGIYSDWSVFYHFTIGPQDGYPADLYAELEGKPGRKDTYGIITIDAKLWEMRTRTLLAFLTHKNPYTGLRYVDDPALAAVEMQNEDSVFFWNPLGWLAEGKKMPLHSKMLREMWAAWVKKKYASDDALKAAWGQLRDGDSVKADELLVMGPWELAGKGPQGRFAGEDRRAGDYIAFLAEFQRGCFERCEKAMRDAGLKCLSMTTAWQVGGPATDAANIWTDTVGSMIDRHNYSGGGAGVHSITEGKVNNESALAHPGGGIFSVGMKQVETKPFSISEWTQSPPNQWKAETAPIMAFYAMGLQGWDMSTHFIQSGVRLADGWGGGSYVTDTPHFIGQFPALAFALHHGHIAEAPIAAARRLSRADLFSGKDPLKQDSTKGGYDMKTLVNNGGTPPEVFAIGRVTVDFSGGTPEQVDFAKYWDEKSKVINSMTGELTWDYGHQVITIHAPKTQAIIGRTNGQTFQLPGVTAEFKTPFVSVIFTPLDDLPLATSKHILITALAQDKQTGARYNADGTILEAVGTAPLLLEPVQATLKFAGAKPTQVRGLDAFGVPSGKAVPVGEDGSVTIDGTYRAFYYDVIR